MCLALCISLALLVSLPEAAQGADAGAAAVRPGMTAAIVSGPAGALRIAVLDCHTGRESAHVRLSERLAVAVAVDFAGGAVFAATRTPELLRFSLPDLALTARVALPSVPTALAVPADPDAVVLVGGAGDEPLIAFDPHSLAVQARYPASPSATVASIVDLAARRRMVVGFADLPELWEIAYGHDAPDVLRGLVHDYRSGEWVALPGRLTPRPFEVPTATRALVPGPSSFEVLRIDQGGAIGVVNLDVRREIERPAITGMPTPQLVAPWRAASGRGWLIATREGRAYRLDAPSWRLAGIELGGVAVALAAIGDASTLLAVLAPPSPSRASTESASLLAVRTGHVPWGLEPLGSLPASPQTVAQLARAADASCTAALDADGRWIAALEHS